MKKKLLNILKITGFILVGAALFWLVYRNQDFKSIFEGIKKAKLGWVLFVLLLGIFSHISRAYRWALLMEPIGYKPRKLTVFYSIMIMYLTNFAIPRSGEVVRCGIVNRYEKVPFTSLLGTVITERAVDMIILLLLTVVVVITQYTVVGEFFNNNPSAKQTFQNLLNSKWLIFGFLFFVFLIIALIVIFRKKIAQTNFYKKIQKLLSDFANGIKSVLKLKKKWEFIAHSIFIWAMYMLMLYFAFKAFDFTKSFGLTEALAILVISSYGMVVPSPGGIGTWHFLAIETLFVYGVDKLNAGTFALVTHESQTVLLIIAGLICLLAASLVKTKDSIINSTNQTQLT